MKTTILLLLIFITCVVCAQNRSFSNRIENTGRAAYLNRHSMLAGTSSTCNLTSSASYYYYLGTGYSDTTFYNYDASNRVISEVSKDMNSINTQKVIYTYNANNTINTKEYLSWNTSTSSYQTNGNKNVYSYNANNTIATINHYNWNSSNSVYDLYYTDFYTTYDANNNCTQILQKDYNASTISYNNSYKSDLTYTVFNKINQVLYFKWDNTLNNYTNYGIENYTYDATNDLKKIIGDYGWNATTNSYDSHGVINYYYCASPASNSLPQSIAAGNFHSLAICSDGSISAWGTNNYGALGDGTNSLTNFPVKVGNLANVIKVAAGEEFSLALRNDGTVWAWGHNDVGQLGNGTNSDSNIPVQVPGLTGVTSIDAGWRHALAVKSDGTVWAWGNNFYGQLGNGGTANSNLPMQVSGLSGVIDVSGGDFHSLALKNDGTVKAWGRNDWGQLGNGTWGFGTDSNVPVSVNGVIGITRIIAGDVHSMVLKNDGTVWNWGSNFNGALGNGTTVNQNPSAVQVSGLTGVTAIGVGGLSSLALKSDGTVWSWGDNGQGHLGNGTSGNGTNSNVPIQVNSLTGVSAIAGDEYHCIALKNDGALYVWGFNYYGILANGTSFNTTTTSPVLVNGLCQTQIGVKELSQNRSLTVFPNPSTGNFTLKIEEAQWQSNNLEVEILNAFGQKVYSGKMNSVSSEFDLDLANGIYFVQLKSQSIISIQKIIIQK